jgi:methanogenic corrinoid protein MtbC1
VIAPTTDLAAALTTRYVAAQLAGDRRAALGLVDEGLAQGLSAAELQLQVVQPAQYEIGRLWQENRITVAQEHLATAISQLVLAHLYRHLRREESNGRRVVVACVEGELHDMGARVAADHLEMSGYDVHYLGANVPTDDIVAMMRDDPPDLLALSASMPAHLPAIKDVVSRVCEATGNRVPIALGGRAFAGTEADYATTGTLVSCTTIERLVAEAKERVGGER